MIQAELTCSAVWALQASVMPASNHDRQLPARRNRSIHRRLRAHGAMQGRQVMLSVISWIFPGLERGSVAGWKLETDSYFESVGWVVVSTTRLVFVICHIACLVPEGTSHQNCRNSRRVMYLSPC